MSSKIYTYAPLGVCTRQIVIQIEEGKVKKAEFGGGCHGNTQGITALVEGMPVEEVVRRLKGIDCRGKNTSCPDQLAVALEYLLATEQNS